MIVESPAFQALKLTEKTKEDRYINEVLKDYWVSCVSREVSLLGRKEVLTGKAKFGILGDGKEVPQVAMARAFRKGDWRSGYYRDQTFMFALGLSSVEDYFAQLYADAENDPFSGGRQMNAHFATPTIDAEGKWMEHAELYNISSDMSPTAGQMARGLGLAMASKVYRNNPELKGEDRFSRNGDELCVITIGDASTSEGVFWETVNAAAVMKVPVAISVWDDGYGISVPIELQTAKGSISEALAGFNYDPETGQGMRIYTAKAWDYVSLCEMYERAFTQMRKDHVPVLFHIKDVTQPQGHSTSGSHERYKSPERLAFEQEMDCIVKMEEWMIETGIATHEKLDEIHDQAVKYARECKANAWKNYSDPAKKEWRALQELGAGLVTLDDSGRVAAVTEELKRMINPLFAEVVQVARRMDFVVGHLEDERVSQLRGWLDRAMQTGDERYHTHLYSPFAGAAERVPVVRPSYSQDSAVVNGYQVLNRFFDLVLERDARVLAFGEDVGRIGGVNQGFAGLQEKYGTHRVFDTGIREWTIIGQAIGLAMRGLRPIAEIQYLDYLLYGLEPLSDDLATLRYRSNGTQMAPAIIRTRGHRLEGIWHAGSPMGMILNALRGMYVLVPRNMTQAVGFYNTLLKGEDPGLVIECLNGYRLKEKMPDNIGDYTVPLGQVEVLHPGTDVTLVTYGSSVRIAEEAVHMLEENGISVELIDVQSLLPFDLEGGISHSIEKTNRVVFLDEDVPGGATAYMMQEVLEKQNAYKYLDSAPVTITAKAHRPPFGSDGDYFSKPNPEDIYEAVYLMMREAEPDRFTWKKG